MKKKNLYLSIIVFVTYLLMILMNSLANILPINGNTTGEVSDVYTNLFTPIGLTFSIWGLIYLLFFAYSLDQLMNAQQRYEKQENRKVAWLFILSSLINSLWIVAWHYEQMGLSLILMLVLLISLIFINLELKTIKMKTRERFFQKLPFFIYFGWITVATIANVTVFLVSLEWNRFGLSEVFWADVIIVIGALIGFATMLYFRSYSYGIVIIWAYIGIVMKHSSSDYYDGQYLSVIVAAVLSISLIVVGETLVYRIERRKRA